MKLATYAFDDGTRPCVIESDTVIDVCRVDNTIPSTMIGLLQAGDAAMDAVRSAIEKAPRLSFEAQKLMAPIARPGKIMALGLNYADHVSEMGRERPDHQTWFSKAPSGVVGSGEAILKPVVSNQLDYEAELCLVIGKHGKHVPPERAFEIIAGYTCGNDVSVRDWQRRTSQFVIGKSFDTHAPIGPYIVTTDEIDDPHALNIKSFVNDEVRQSSNTRNMMFKIPDIIADLTSAMTLEPGDVIFTGTPEGVGAGMDPKGFMKAGDTVRVEIETVGTLTNTVIAEERRTEFR